MNPHDDNRDEEPIAPFLAATEKDAVPPDREFLARLRVQSTEAFAAAASQPLPISQRKRPMFFRAVYWLGTAAAAVLVCGVGLYFWLVAGAVRAHVRQGAGERRKRRHRPPARPPRQRPQANRVLAHEPAETFALGRSRGQLPHRRRTELLDRQRKSQRGPANGTAAGREPARDALPRLAGTAGGAGGSLKRVPVERIARAAWTFWCTAWKCPRRRERFGWMRRWPPETRRLRSIRTRLEKDGKIEPFGELTVLAYDEPIDAGEIRRRRHPHRGRPHRQGDRRPGHRHHQAGAARALDARARATSCSSRATGCAPMRAVPMPPPSSSSNTPASSSGRRRSVELVRPKQIRLIEGEIEITPAADAPVELLGPDKQKIDGQGQATLPRRERATRPRREGTALAARASRGRRRTSRSARSSPRSMAAMCRSRSAITRSRSISAIRSPAPSSRSRSSTTPTRVLEGVFYFPLPQDASISGFGMWIGDKLVEADVVEKQRAREIYETILREKRDPGLLEWSGGNIFKARVFPIPAHSRETHQDHLHAGAAAQGQPLSLQLRPAKRTAPAAPAARPVDRREGQFGGAAQERDLADAPGPRSTRPRTPATSSSRPRNTRRRAISRPSSRSRAGSPTSS